MTERPFVRNPWKYASRPPIAPATGWAAVYSRLTMERGSLRPVPLRPHGPVDPSEAARHVAASLPGLGPDAARALALVEIAGRSRPDVAAEMAVSPADLADLLHSARKALRRSIFPLAATGWCERAERLLSERLDGVLDGTGPARLDVHLAHCERCVEHERRLAGAREGLVRSFVESHAPAPEPEPEPAPPAGLRVVAAPPPELEPEPLPEPAPLPVRAAPAIVAVSQGSRAWTALYAVALALAVASVVLTVLAATGAVERIF